MTRATKEIVNFWIIMSLALYAAGMTAGYLNQDKKLAQYESDLYIEKLKASLPKVFTSPRSHRIVLVRVWPDSVKVYYRDDTIDIFPLREDGASLYNVMRQEEK